MKYAYKTSVPIDKSRAEIEKTLSRYKADQFASAIDNEARRVAIQFRLRKVVVRFEMMLPKDDQGQRQRWRALCLAIKAKLEAVESGITTFEEEFLAHIVTSTGETVGKTVIPSMLKAIEDGAMPSVLLEWHR